jgi:hypothetical protein
VTHLVLDAMSLAHLKGPFWEDRGSPEVFARLVGSGANRFEADLVAVTRGQPGRVLRAFGSTVCDYAYGYSEDYRENRAHFEACRPAVDRLAEALGGLEESQWWFAELDRARQVETAEANGYSIVGDLASDNEWWVAPIGRDVFQTTRGPVGDAPSVAAVCADPALNPGDAPVTVPSSAGAGKVLEVASREAFGALLADFGVLAGQAASRTWTGITGRRGRWARPDWARVAREYDGAHLTLGAYLAQAYAPIDLGSGVAGILAGWSPDATVWFHNEPLRRLPGRG